MSTVNNLCLVYDDISNAYSPNEAFSDSLEYSACRPELNITIDDKTSALGVKNLIAEKAGVSADHVLLNVKRFYWTSGARNNLGKFRIIGDTENMMELTRTKKEKSGGSLSETVDVHAQVIFSFITCKKTDHCEYTVLKVSALTGWKGTLSFDSKTSINDLETQCSKTYDFPLGQFSFIKLEGSHGALDKSTLVESLGTHQLGIVFKFKGGLNLEDEIKS